VTASTKAALAFAPALVWALLLLWVGSRTLSGPDSTLPLDKVAHFTMYGVLGGLAGYGWRRVDGGAMLAAVLLIAALAVGALDENNQRSVPGRDADAADWIADALGAATGFLLVARSARLSRFIERDDRHRA